MVSVCQSAFAPPYRSITICTALGKTMMRFPACLVCLFDGLTYNVACMIATQSQTIVIVPRARHATEAY
jgi:hypothetical protein